MPALRFNVWASGGMGFGAFKMVCGVARQLGALPFDVGVQEPRCAARAAPLLSSGVGVSSAAAANCALTGARPSGNYPRWGNNRTGTPTISFFI